MKFTISCLLTLQMLHTKFGKDWPSSSWEEDVNARRTTDDDGRQPRAIGHLSDSGDLNISLKAFPKYMPYYIDFQACLTRFTSFYISHHGVVFTKGWSFIKYVQSMSWFYSFWIEGTFFKLMCQKKKLTKWGENVRNRWEVNKSCERECHNLLFDTMP